MDVAEKDPKARKKAIIRQRNKKLFIKHMQLEAVERENERARHEEEMKMESYKRAYSGAIPEIPGANEETRGKVAHYRNLITGRKRAAHERWNRFAGTGDSGGRGL